MNIARALICTLPLLIAPPARAQTSDLFQRMTAALQACSELPMDGLKLTCFKAVTETALKSSGGAPAATPPEPDTTETASWDRDAWTDPFDDSQNLAMTLKSDRRLSCRTHKMELIARCRKDQFDLFFWHGCYGVETNDNLVTALIRFGQDAPVTYKLPASSDDESFGPWGDQSSMAMFDEMRDHDKLAIRFGDGIEATFDLRGIEAAASELEGMCLPAP